MSPKRITFGLGGLLLVLLSGLSAFGQEGVRDLPATQLFDPADVRPYGDWEAPKDGFYFDFDGLWWTISAPKKTLVGQPGTVFVFTGPTQDDQYPETSNLDTGLFRAKQTGGDRIEFGYTDEHHGFLFSAYELNCQTQVIDEENVNMVFADPGFGNNLHFLDGIVGQVGGVNVIERVPVNFSEVTLVNHTYTNGVELLYTYRQHLTHNGGQIQWMMGARYVRFDDEFLVDANGGNLANSEWDTSVKNRIYGPEVGVRWSREFGRFALSSEGRFMAGINDQTIQQYGTYRQFADWHDGQSRAAAAAAACDGVGSIRPRNGVHPVGRVAVRGARGIDQADLVQGRLDGMFMDNIGRASDMVDYTMPALGILTANNKQMVFMQGINVGIELNR